MPNIGNSRAQMFKRKKKRKRKKTNLPSLFPIEESSFIYRLYQPISSIARMSFPSLERKRETEIERDRERKKKGRKKRKEGKKLEEELGGWECR